MLKAPKVIDMKKLMEFVPPIYCDYFKDIVERHKEVIAAYNKNKKKKKNQDEDEEEDDDNIEHLF